MKVKIQYVNRIENAREGGTTTVILHLRDPINHVDFEKLRRRLEGAYLTDPSFLDGTTTPVNISKPE